MCREKLWFYQTHLLTQIKQVLSIIKLETISITWQGWRGEEGQPQQFLARATFSSFYRPSHLEILVLWIYGFLSV